MPVPHARAVEDRHGAGRARPLGRVSLVVDHVAEVGRDLDVQGAEAVDDPLGLGVEDRGPGRGRRVVLRVRERDDREVGRRGRDRPAVERDVHVVGVRVGDGDVERRRRGDAGCAVRGADEGRGVRGVVRGGTGNPGVTQTGPFVSVPFSAGVVESAVVVPVPSFRPQRPRRPVPDVTSRFLLARMSPADRAAFQTRASSMTPEK